LHRKRVTFFFSQASRFKFVDVAEMIYRSGAVNYPSAIVTQVPFNNIALAGQNALMTFL
jgi:hypothetical protein